MLEKIRLDKDKLIAFMGSMNGMPMMYALELKKLGYDVIYFVDVTKKDTLSRPENRFPDISYPYPAWIIEMTLPSQIVLPLFPKFFASLYERRIRAISRKEVDCFILNGFFSSLSPYLNKFSSKVSLSHGSDLDVWANIKHTDVLVKSFKNKSIFKYLPNVFVQLLIKNIVKTQYLGYSRSDTVVYFPRGFSSHGDGVLRQLEKQGVKYVPRYDISFEPLSGQSREFKYQSKRIEIFSGVRFLFKTFLEGNEGCNKGNDIIIKGVAKYFSINPNIRVHFVEKGDDIQFAKELCLELGIENIIEWHKEMPFKKLLKLYQIADVCFDQVGNHWIGAIGKYALWLGKPLIANPESAVVNGVWSNDNPVLSAKTPEEVCDWLVRLENIEFRREVSNYSKEFVDAYMEPQVTLSNIFEC